MNFKLVQESYLGGQYIGKIFAKLDGLQNDVKEQNPSCVAFVDALRDLKEVYSIAHKKDLVPNHREIVKNWIIL